MILNKVCQLVFHTKLLPFYCKVFTFCALCYVFLALFSTLSYLYMNRSHSMCTFLCIHCVYSSPLCIHSRSFFLFFNLIETCHQEKKLTVPRFCKKEMIVLEYKAMYNIWVKVLSDFFTDKESLGGSILNFNKCRNTWMMAILVRAVVQWFPFC